MRKFGRLAIVQGLERKVWEEYEGIREKGGNKVRWPRYCMHGLVSRFHRRTAPLLPIIHIDTWLWNSLLSPSGGNRGRILHWWIGVWQFRCYVPVWAPGVVNLPGEKNQKIHMTRQHMHATDICKKLVFCLCRYDFPLDVNNLTFLHALKSPQ